MTATEIKERITEIKEEIEAVKGMEVGEYWPAWEKERDLNRLYAELGKIIAAL